MIEEKLCDERHEIINRVLTRIESKLDGLVWKIFSVMISLIDLLFVAITRWSL